MILNSQPDIFNHFLFLPFLHPLIEVLGVDCRHQHYPIMLKMISGEIWTMPYSSFPLIIESYVIISDRKGPKSIMKLMKPSKCLAQHI